MSYSSKNKPKEYFLQDDEIFPNSKYPVLHYKHILDIPALFAGLFIKKLFRNNNWSNNWRSGIYTYHHYHSITHEAMGVVKGTATLQLGGEHGIKITLDKGDVIIIPAGVAHKNLDDENDIVCIGGYPNGRDFDILCGRQYERPKADRNIAAVPIPATDPIFGKNKGIATIWKKYH